MKKGIENFKASVKRSFALLIAGILFCSGMFTPWIGWSVNAADSSAEGVEQGPSDGFESLIITNINKSNTTASADSIQLNTTLNSLGKVSNNNTGFSFKVTTPQSAENATNKKMLNFNLYNKTGVAWRGGYLLNIAPGTTEGSVTCTFNYMKSDSTVTSGYKETAISGTTNTLSGVGNEMLVSVWLDSDKLNVMINGTLLTKVPSTSLDGLDLGLYMLGRKQDNVANDITVSDSGTAKPDSTISFEDISKTQEEDSITLVAGNNQHLGQVSSMNKGFRFKVTTPKGTDAETSELSFGLYNTADSIEKGGYILRFAPSGAEKKISWELAYNDMTGKLDSQIGESKVSQQGTLSGVGDEITVNAWLDSNSKLNVIVDGKQIVKALALPTGGRINTHMNSLQGNGVENEIKLSAFATLPKGVSFDTLETPSISPEYDEGGTAVHTKLGSTADTNNGFSFKMTLPSSRGIKLGLYNSKSTSIWNGGGYILMATNNNGTVSWAIYNHDETVKAEGNPLDIGSGEVEVFVWLSTVGEVQKLNVIMDGTYIVKDGVLNSGKNCPEATTFGIYMSVRNVPTKDNANGAPLPVFKELVQLTPAQPDPNVEFEDICDTLKKNSISLAKGHNRLGKVTETTKGFCFKITTPNNNTVKFGLYNAKNSSIWKDGGYILRIDPVSEQGKVKWQLMDYRDDQGKISNGELSNVGAEMTVYVWLDSSNRLNVIVDDKQIAKEVVTEETNQIGQYMNVNISKDVTDDIVVKALNPSEEGEEPEGSNVSKPVPTDIVFEDIGQTIEANSVTIGNKAYANMGQVSNENKGFQVKVELPKDTGTKGYLKMGFFNKRQGSPWSDGYLLRFTSVNANGATLCSLRMGKDEEVLTKEIPVQVASEVEVKAWLTDIDGAKHKFFVAINGVIFAEWENDGSIATGLYMTAYNTWEQDVTFKTFKTIIPRNEQLPVNTSKDPTKGVEFEDLLTTSGTYSITLPGKTDAALGELSSLDKGFMLRVSTPKADDRGNPTRLGFYNTKKRSVYADGYLLRMDAGKNSNEIEWSLHLGKKEEKLTSGTLTGVTDSFMTVKVWLTDRSASGHTLHVVVDGKEIVVNRNNGSTVLGNYMTALKSKGDSMEVKSAAVNLDMSGNTEGIEFVDIGKLILQNEKKLPQSQQVLVGMLDSSNVGFEFLLSPPAKEDVGKTFKISFYNTVAGGVWKGGYVLVFRPNEDGSMMIRLSRGKDEQPLTTISNYTPKKAGEKLSIAVWLTSIEGEAGAHVIHVKIDGKEMLAYPCLDGSIELGNYINAYNNAWTNPIIYSVKRVRTISERYLERFGDPTAMTAANAGNGVSGNGNVGGDTSVGGSTKGDGSSGEGGHGIIGYVIGGVAAVIGITGGTTAVILFKRKKKIDSQNG